MILPPLGKATAVSDEQLQVDVDEDEEVADEERAPGREACRPSPATHSVSDIVSYQHICNLHMILDIGYWILDIRHYEGREASACLPSPPSSFPPPLQLPPSPW